MIKTDIINNDSIRIGMFDSGSGGLTVLKEVSSQLPDVEFIYLGDIARMPYGDKTPEAIVKIGLQSIQYLIKKHNVDMIVIACNTVSSHMGTLSSRFNIPIVGMIEAVSSDAIDKLKYKGKSSESNNALHNICIIATNATIRSGSYENTLNKLSKDSGLKIKIYPKATPLLAPLVEEGITKGEIVKLLLEHYFKDIPMDKINLLAIGCTHYPLLTDTIEELYPKLIIVDGSKTITNFVQNAAKNISSKYLSIMNRSADNTSTNAKTMPKGVIKILITSHSAELIALAHALLGDNITIENVPLSDVNKPIN